MIHFHVQVVFFLLFVCIWQNSEKDITVMTIVSCLQDKERKKPREWRMIPWQLMREKSSNDVEWLQPTQRHYRLHCKCPSKIFIALVTMFMNKLTHETTDDDYWTHFRKKRSMSLLNSFEFNRNRSLNVDSSSYVSIVIFDDARLVNCDPENQNKDERRILFDWTCLSSK